MQYGLRSLSFTVALIVGVGTGAAGATDSNGASTQSNMKKSELTLTRAQEQKIIRDLATESMEPAAAHVHASTGSKIPESVALHPLPTAVATDVPAAKNYSYAKLHDDDIVIVDPKNRVVADVIKPEPSTTGSSNSFSR